MVSATPDQKSDIELEFDRYFSMPRPDFASADVCKWWKKYEKELPNLAAVARRYLSIIMSSAASERLFSIAGQTVNDLRTQLDPDNVEKIVFLRSNLPLVRTGQLVLETEDERLERLKMVGQEEDQDSTLQGDLGTPKSRMEKRKSITTPFSLAKKSRTLSPSTIASSVRSSHDLFEISDEED